MAGRVAARYISRRFSSGGKVLSEEEKAAENVYIKCLSFERCEAEMVSGTKKMEKEKLEKLARQGPKPAETSATGSEAPVTGAKPSGPDPPTANVSTDKYRNYAVLAGTITALGALGWYLKSGSKKTEEVQD